jgi:hypothetical protein
MTHDNTCPDNRPKEKTRTLMIGVRVNEDQKACVEMAAEREGLRVSSYIITMLVRLKVLPEGSLRKLKRYPVPYYCTLHGLLGAVNTIGGNCKQLASILPDGDVCSGVHKTHARIIDAAAAITEALRGKAIPEDVNLYRLQADMSKLGRVFDRIVKSVNIGKPDLAGLPTTLAAITYAANTITAALTGQQGRGAALPDMKVPIARPVQTETDLRKKAVKKRLAGMWKMAAKHAKRRKGRPASHRG